jgi:serine/threonine-protein kinase
LIQAAPLSVDEARGILTQVAEALYFLHTNKLVYCDLKPANIIVRELPASPQGRDFSCTFIDFGIAERIEREANTQAAQKNITGTSHYLSPEQVRGTPLDQRSDIYAFGVLGYELLAGKPPFTQAELFSATASHLIGKVTPLRDSHPHVPKVLSTLLEICLAKDPEDRYHAMTEVLERLTAREEPGFLQKLLAHWQRIITIPARAQKRRSDQGSADTPLNEGSRTPNSHLPRQ